MKKPLSFICFIIALILTASSVFTLISIDIAGGFALFLMITLLMAFLLVVIGLYKGYFYTYKEQESRLLNRIGLFGNALYVLTVIVLFIVVVFLPPGIRFH